jgi:hypothetical protein
VDISIPEDTNAAQEYILAEIDWGEDGETRSISAIPSFKEGSSRIQEATIPPSYIAMI